ncbi:MAG TPA: response regulator [Nevskiaceae bacterium]
MVVDDSQTIRRTAETLLGREGFRVIAAADGFEALAQVVEQRPDVIFIDIMMPRLDGYQACALIKANEEYAGIPVIMLSYKDGLFDRARGRLAGCDEYLTKPFTRDELVGAVRAQLARKADARG